MSSARWFVGSITLVLFGCARRPPACPTTSAAPTTSSPRADAFEPHTVLFHGKLVTLRAVEIEGNARIDSDVLRARIDSARTGILDDDTLERDTLLLEALYYDHGYVAVKIAEPTTTMNAAGELVVRWRVSEGDQYFVSRLHVYEKTATGEAAPMAGWSLPADAQHGLFSRRDLMTELTALNTLYRDAGYAFVDATPLTEIDPLRHTIAIDLPIVRGPLVHVEKVRILGNEIIGEATIREALLVHEGDVYSETKLETSKRRLKETEWFDRVDVSMEKAGGDAAVKVTFEVTESARIAPFKTAAR